MCALGHNIITLDRLLREAQTDRRKSNGSGPFYRTGPTHSNKSLVGLGALLSYLGAAAGSLRFAFLVRRDARCLRLVLLGPAFASEVVTTSHAPDDFSGLAFAVLDPPQWRTWFARLTPLTGPPSDRPGKTARCGTAAQDSEPSATSVRVPTPSHAQTSDAAPRLFMQIVHPRPRHNATMGQDVTCRSG